MSVYARVSVYESGFCSPFVYLLFFDVELNVLDVHYAILHF